MIKFLKKISFFNCFLYFYFFYFAVLFWLNNFLFVEQQQYILLAYSFLKGKLYFLKQLGLVYDASFFQNRFYWPLGPLPAVLLIPLILVFGFKPGHQGLLSFVFILANYFILKKLLDYFGYIESTQNWLIFFYLLATAYFGVSCLPYSWYLAHTTATFFIFLSFLVFFKYKRFFLTGLCVGLATLCRPTTAPTILFFILYLWFENKKPSFKSSFKPFLSKPSLGLKLFLSFFSKNKKKIFYLCLPFLSSVLIFAGYNFLRFGHAGEAGYSYQLINGIIPETRKLWGLINWRYFFKNFYFLFLRGLLSLGSEGFVFFLSKKEGLYEGLGLLLTTPAIFLILKNKFRTAIAKAAGISSLVIILSLLFSFSHGAAQLGTRLSLDFLPLWFLIFLNLGLKKIKFQLKLLFIGQFLINLYLIYPYIASRL